MRSRALGWVKTIGRRARRGASPHPADACPAILTPPLQCRRWIIGGEQISQFGGLAYHAHLPPILRDLPSGCLFERPLELVVLEDDCQLGPSDSLHQAIRERGRGRYSLSGGYLVFSSSDFSDPRENRRIYSLRIWQRPPVHAEPRTEHTIGSFPDRLGLEPREMKQLQGLGWSVRLTGFLSVVRSDLELNNGSRLSLFEDDTLLGPGHAIHETVRQQGRGAWSHWGTELIFSTSDLSDPRCNGRRYSLGVAPEQHHCYLDLRVDDQPPLAVTLPAPVLLCDSPADRQGLLATSRPVFRVGNPNPALSYTFELDTSSNFDSANLQRRPRLGVGRTGPAVLHLMDREADFGPTFRPSYRLGVLAPSDLSLDHPQRPRQLAMRLGRAMNNDRDIVREVYEYLRCQFYPHDESDHVPTVNESLRRQRGMCFPTSQVVQRLLMELGFRCRSVSANSSRFASLHKHGAGQHWSSEVFFEDGWNVVDPWFQYFLPGISWRRLHLDHSLLSTPAYFLGPGPDHDGLGVLLGSCGESLALRLSDFAALRSYDHPDSFHPIAAEMLGADEEKLFAGMRAQLPHPPFEKLWQSQQLCIHVRVRGFLLDSNWIAHRASNQAAVGAPPAYLEATPWAEIGVKMDLLSAYTDER